MNKKTIIIASTGLAIGLTEALVYYNMGKNSNSGKFRVLFPKGKELLKTVCIVFISSITTAGLSNMIEKTIEKTSKS